jgi:hypothetical protein
VAAACWAGWLRVPGWPGTCWSNKYFPQQDGQTLECFTYISGGSPFPAYAWSFPTENAFLWALGNAGTSWSALDTWWKDNETQAAAPSPPAS